ncbi:MAG: transporter substrate-binding domain-containing protein, partial [Christensenellales bacterium]|nr:transporter substrate-binding domain-containing protein [Christensenellales bacterium]
MLNITEEESLAFEEARLLTVKQLIKEGYAHSPRTPEEIPENLEIAYYDTIDALLMALNARQINGILIYKNVASYLCATNDTMRTLVTFDTDQPLNTFAKLVYGGINGNDFSFLMMEDRTELRDEFNAVIAEIKEEGTLDRLVAEQIDAMVDGSEIKPVELPRID